MQRRAALVGAVLVGALLVGVALLGALSLAARRIAPPGSPSPVDDLVTLSPAPPGPGDAAPPDARHLVLVIGCTVRRDQTSLHGGPPAATPFLTQLAAEGARFDDLVTAAPWTRAASTAILTGHHPISVGMADPSPRADTRVLPAAVTTLAEHLHEHGWRTVGLTTNPNLNAVYGFDQGFDVYRQPARLWREASSRTDGARAVDEALRLVDALPPSDAPLFLEVVLIDAHAPHVADGRERATFADPDVPVEVVRYRAALRRLDDAVAQLEAGLRARGFGPDDTVFAFANDHGEGLRWPAHHGGSHGRTLAPSSVGGVFVARGPGVAPGTVIGGVASQLDLAPTLAALVGAPGLPAAGRDRSSELTRRAAPAPAAPVFTETWFKEVDRAAVYTDDRACQLDFAPPDPDPDAAPSTFVDGCFDRRRDPLHAAPLRDEALESTLRQWRAARQAEADRVQAASAAPDDATRSQLEALGYSD